MPDVPVSSLDVRQQTLVANARLALERGNLDYVVEACGQVLRAAPGCLPVRKLQRAAQLRLFRTKNRLLAKALGGWSAAPFLLGTGKHDPAEVLAQAEKQLAADPTSVAALKLLAGAARALDWPETAAFACEAVRELAPQDRANLLELGEAWLAAGRPSEALRAADAILARHPVDAAGQTLMRKALIAETMVQGQWGSTAGFREKLKHERPASPREPAAPASATGGTPERAIEDALARLVAEPDNLVHVRTLVQAYRQLGRSEDALAWVRRARQQPQSSADPTWEQWEGELQVAVLELRLAAAEAGWLLAPDDAAVQARRAEARAELEGRRLAEAQRRVERYPNDVAARQELGGRLLEAGRIEEAIAQFQQAQRSPAVRVAALCGLGRCFRAKRLLDLAVVQFALAKAELGAMDEAKKTAIYELGCCLEAMGRGEAAIAEFKLIYSEDIGFRDVAERVNAYYARA